MIQDAGAFPPQLFADFLVVVAATLELLLPFLDGLLDLREMLVAVEEPALASFALKPGDLSS